MLRRIVTLDGQPKMRVELAASQVERMAKTRRGARDQMRLGEHVALDGASRRCQFPDAGFASSAAIASVSMPSASSATLVASRGATDCTNRMAVSTSPSAADRTRI